MYRWGVIGGLLAALVTAAPLAATAAEPKLRLIGAGATFPAPLYLRWARGYNQMHPEIQVDYQAMSSAGGVHDLTLGLVDFTGTDLRLTEAEEAQVPGGVVQLPMAVGAIVLVYNLEGVEGLRLSRDAVVGIFDGSIARWNDPRIAAANPGATLHDLPITVVTRVGASGTSYSLTDHLGHISPSFADAVPTSLSPVWPERLMERGGLVKASGNDGVAASVRAIPGSIGYVQYAYAFLTGMGMAAIENRNGKIVAPNAASFRAAVQGVRAEGNVASLIDPPGDEAYPIIGVSWLVLRRAYDPPEKLQALIGFIDYALGPGQADAAPLGYIPYSEDAIAHVRGELAKLRATP